MSPIVWIVDYSLLNGNRVGTLRVEALTMLCAVDIATSILAKRGIIPLQVESLNFSIKREDKI